MLEEFGGTIMITYIREVVVFTAFYDSLFYAILILSEIKLFKALQRNADSEASVLFIDC